MRQVLVQLLRLSPPSAIDREYHDTLTIHSTYYRQLTPELQQRFRQRLYRLLRVLRFGSGHFKQVTREMRTVIGCAIIEITFGLRNYLPTRFTRVMVLPRRYMYPGYGQPFLGHIDHRNDTIFFSWQDVQHGYLVSDDAVNVALHEMAHVLEVENVFFSIFNSFFKRVSWEEWAEVAFRKMQLIRAGQNEFLKSYGGINMSEMFAVCIEAFFERSDEFANQLPELYQTMVELLRQDPRQGLNPLWEG